MHILLDTTNYISAYPLNRPDFKALRTYLHTTHSRLLFPNVVKLELEKKIKFFADQENDRIRRSHSKRLGIMPEQTEPLDEKMLNELRESLRRMYVTDIDQGDIALEQLITRSIDEMPPFQTKGRGFRDTLIWLSLLNYLETNQEAHVAFISANSEDFGSNSLKKELQAEIEERGFSGRLFYFNHINDFLTEYSEPISFIDEAYIYSAVEGNVESEASGYDGEDLDDIDYPSRDVEWEPSQADYVDFEVTNYYIYKTTNEHYYLYVEVWAEYEVELLGVGTEHQYDPIRNDYSYDLRHYTEYTQGHKSFELSLKINKENQEVETVQLDTLI